jgi:hypothetical protein
VCAGHVRSYFSFGVAFGADSGRLRIRGQFSIDKILDLKSTLPDPHKTL